MKKYSLWRINITTGQWNYVSSQYASDMVEAEGLFESSVGFIFFDLDDEYLITRS